MIQIARISDIHLNDEMSEYYETDSVKTLKFLRMILLNNKRVKLFMLLILFASSPAQPMQNDPPEGLPASRTKADILLFFSSLIDQNKILVGQQCGDNGIYDIQGSYDMYFEKLKQMTGKYPALLGNDYGIKPGISTETVNEILIRHWRAGGLVTLSWHADCPWTDGYDMRWSSSLNKQEISLSSLLKDAAPSAAKDNYRRELASVGKALSELKNAGVIVLWRPFHEMNGDWFWWGADDINNPGNREDFRLLWIDMYKTFTDEFSLNNLIWIYSVNYSCEWTASADAMYPGSEYVDILGVDVYTDEPSFSDYKTLKKYGKPLVISETGPGPLTEGQYDELSVIDAYAGKAAYFLQWHSWRGARMAIIDNKHFREMMFHPAAVTLYGMMAE